MPLYEQQESFFTVPLTPFPLQFPPQITEAQEAAVLLCHAVHLLLSVRGTKLTAISILQVHLLVCSHRPRYGAVTRVCDSWAGAWA